MNILDKRNILEIILSLSSIPYTTEYTRKFFNEHPYKYNLLGLSRMLEHYNLDNMGIRVLHKEDLLLLSTPFIAYASGDFVVVEKADSHNVIYYWNNKRINAPFQEFLKTWSGIALAIDRNENSIEPNYKLHKKRAWYSSIQQYLLVVACIVLLVIGFLQNPFSFHLGFVLALLLNLTGVYICVLLVQKQIHARSGVADKICSLFSHSDCNNVLNSPVAKFMGVIGWSELGLSYFISNVLLLIFAPQYIPFFALLNIFSLPYSFWSVWYQKVRAKTWCPLCLIVQALFWSIFICNLLSGFIQKPELTLLNILSVGLVYGIPFLILNISLPFLTVKREMTEVTQQFNSLKANEKVFLTLLKERTYYDATGVSNILFGNPHAQNTITIFSNPHCEPCARMHKRIGQLLKDADNRFCVQCILSSFNDSLNSSCEFFLFINNRYSTEERNQIYNKWFEGGKYKKNEFFRKYGFTPDNSISEEYQKHIDWKKKNKLSATPTVLFNGYTLPDMYFREIGLLSYFADMDDDNSS